MRVLLWLLGITGPRVSWLNKMGVDHCYGNRVGHWDIARAVAMFLVVLWHVYFGSYYENDIERPFLANFIVSFNMPAFFLISGRLSRRMLEGAPWKCLVHRELSLFVPFVIFSVVLGCATCFMALDVRPFYLAKTIACRFLYGGWFIWVLAISYAIMFCGSRILRGRYLWLFAIVMYAASFVVPVGVSLPSFRNMFPYFCLGLLVNVPDRFLKNGHVLLICALITVYATFFCGSVYNNGLGWYWVDTDARLYFGSCEAVGRFATRLLFGVSGSVLLVGLSMRISERTKALSGLLCPLGTTTLGVYLLHQWVLTLGERFYGCPSKTMLLPLLVAFVAHVGCHLIILLSMRSGVLGDVLWGRRVLWERIAAHVKRSGLIRGIFGKRA